MYSPCMIYWYFPPICHLVCFTFQREKLVEIKGTSLSGLMDSSHLSYQKTLWTFRTAGITRPYVFNDGGVCINTLSFSLFFSRTTLPRIVTCNNSKYTPWRPFRAEKQKSIVRTETRFFPRQSYLPTRYYERSHFIMTIRLLNWRESKTRYAPRKWKWSLKIQK